MVFISPPGRHTIIRAMIRAHLIAIIVAFGAVSCSTAPTLAPSLLSGTAVDLSHDYSDQTIFWPTAEGFRLDKVADGMTPQGYYYAAKRSRPPNTAAHTSTRRCILPKVAGAWIRFRSSN